MSSNIPILDERREKALARDLARSFVPLVTSAFHAHDQCRRDATDQIKMEVERGAEQGHGGNALYLALKELELSIHSQTMAASINTLAILAALGVEVPVPAEDLPADEETTQ